MNNIKNYILTNRKEVCIVALISFAALAIRIISLAHAGDLWIDELYSLYFASKNSLIDVVKSLYLEDLHTPLYFILLHIWIKLFGDSETVMRLMGFIPTFLIVPLSFYIGKKLFNTKTGYYSALILTVSPLLIYFTSELRFYGTACFLALLSSYFFTLFIHNKTRQNTIALVVINLALLYTFNISFVFVFFQFLYILFQVKDKFKLLKPYLLIFLLYIPAFIMTIHGIFSYKNSICSFANDIFIYKTDFISILLQSYFSGNFFYATQNNYFYNTQILKNLINIKNIYLILFPVIFCLSGFIKGLLSKNKNLAPFMLPAMLFLLFELAFAQFGFMSLIVRYTLISFPIIIIVCAYGFSKFKHGKLINTLLIFYLISILCFIIPKNTAANPIIKETELTKPIKETLLKLDIKQNDYIMIPIMGKLYKRYIPECQNIDFEITDMLLNDVRKYYPIVFDKNLSDKLNQNNARHLLKEYSKGNSINNNIDNYLYNSYFSKMKNGEKFILVINNMNTIISMSELYKKNPYDKERLYYKNSLYYMLTTRIIYDILQSANKHLTPVSYYLINDKKMSDNNTGVFVFIMHRSY